jgi:hypothetical protein
MSQTSSPTESASKSSVLSSPYLWWTLAALSLILGFADLWRGGETIAPILLVLGYLVFIPIAILKR